MKPDTASVKLGESVSFTAYAKEARTRGETKLSPDDLDLLDRVYVLKTKVSDLSFEVFEDFAYPLTTVVKEYPFTNTKEGYNRVWTTSGPGSIAPSGATSGKFTAPTDPAATGKTATVTFISTRNGTSDIARASASVNIEGDGAMYKGTITIKASGKTKFFEKQVSASSQVTLQFQETNFPNVATFRDAEGQFSSSFDQYIETDFESLTGKVTRKQQLLGKAISDPSKGPANAGSVVLEVQ